MDKSLYCWSFEGDFYTDEEGYYNPIKYSSIHDEHTARVMSVYFDPHRSVLYSGGYDGRVIGWSLDHHQLTESIDKAKRVVRDILPVSPHILLVS